MAAAVTRRGRTSSGSGEYPLLHYTRAMSVTTGGGGITHLGPHGKGASIRLPGRWELADTVGTLRRRLALELPLLT